MAPRCSQLAIVAALLFCLAGASLAQVCTVKAKVDPAKSQLVISGTVAAPIKGEIKPNGPVAATGFIYINVPAGGELGSVLPGSVA